MNLPDLSRHTILVAEDDDSNYDLIKVSLRPSNVKLIWAKNGREAIDLCQSNPEVDMILMDGMMPLLTGYEAAIEIRRFRPTLPIVILTAYFSTACIHEAVRSGCNDFMAKPLGIPELYSIIKKWLAYKGE